MKLTFVKLKLMLALAACMFTSPLEADDPERNGPWLIDRDAGGRYTIQTAEMKLHPQGEPKPALKYRLIPDRFDLLEGNAAIYYLKAMGFLEQTAAANKLQEFRNQNSKLAEEKGLPTDSLPPYSWQNLPPAELPNEEVKQYLKFTAFQPPLIAEATRLNRFSLDRNIREVGNPISYLLPEIQTMRELARMQSLRCRLAIAEHRIDDAIKILQQQMTMASHLGTDEFIVSNLVGAAIFGIAMQDMVYLLQEPDAPNLYWALASLRSPLIDFQQSLPGERHLLQLQVKALQEIDQSPRTSGYWQDFIDRVIPQLHDLDLVNALHDSQDPQVERAVFVSMIAAAYPGARRYLIEEWQMDRTKVDALPTTQVVFLAAKNFYEQYADHSFKWFGIPYEQALGNSEFKKLDEILNASSNRIGWASAPTRILLPALRNIRNAQQHVQHEIALMQTIEAIRMYSAQNAGKLPPSLEALPYPAPNDPFTGKPFAYELTDNQALLSGQPTPYLQFRFKLSVAK